MRRGDAMEPNWQDMASYAWTGGAGILGRLMYHARQVQRGHRKPLTWALFWDLPIAFGMGWFVLGMCDYFSATSSFAVSMAIGASYLGPYSVDRVFVMIGDKYFGGKG